MAAAVSRTVLDTPRFEEWESLLDQTVGHHRSTLLTPEIPFHCRMQVVQAEQVGLMAVQGQSSVALHRHQPDDRIVLWLPRQGWVQERLNGREVVAEPGSAMLCLPGDELLGHTSPQLEGVSLLLPSTLLADEVGWRGFEARHLQLGSEARAVIATADDLVTALLAGRPEADWLLSVLADQLLYWRDLTSGIVPGAALGSVERRRLIARARQWMEAHLDQPFRLADLAAGLHFSGRSLQLCFREELGHPPLVEARRLRLRRLRRLLRSTPPAEAGLETLCRACGLSDSAQTRRHYLQWCGETMVQSQAQAVSR